MMTPEQAKAAFLGAVDVAAGDYGRAVEEYVADPLESRIFTLEEENARLQARLDALNPKMWVGACNNLPSGLPADNTLANFLRYDVGWSTRRSFPKVDSIVRTVEADRTAGKRPFVSLQPGTPDATKASIALGMGDASFTEPHEPENSMTASAFVTGWRNTYRLMKDANSALQMGPVYLGYAWRNAAKGVGDAGTNTGVWFTPEEWDVGDECDFYGIDVYAARGVPLEQYPNFQNWYAYFGGKGKPVRVVEYGQIAVPFGSAPDPAVDARRADLYLADAEYLTGLGNVEEFLFWHGGGKQGLWAPDGPKAKEAMRQITAAGRAA